ncbi:unnamed protein product [Cuscuta campestris]|uniref:Uncharacterized protein n=1 Tax=Cuscuta campestris TaxID=132261 RepID=A0A484NLS2_9ASTE|nr:unnamed protein product [Cuscuta campestris]
MVGSISKSCPLIERLVFESSKAGRDCCFRLHSCYDLLSNCPNISSLALRGFQLLDSEARMLVEGFHKLKHVDFSTSYALTGSLLKNHGDNAVQDILEVLILRDCMHLEEAEVVSFFSAVLAGDFTHLKHIDISNGKSSCSRRLIFFIPFKQLLEARPDLCVLANFPEECEGSTDAVDFGGDSHNYPVD